MLEIQKTSIMHGVRICPLFILAAALFDVSAQRKECEKALVGDIVFLVDSSSSIRPNNFELVKTFLGNLIKSFDIDPKKIQIGLAQYSSKTHKEFLLKDHADQESVLTAVDRLHYFTGRTWTGEALNFLRKHYFVEAAGSRVGEQVPQIAVLITDGKSDDSVEEPARQLREHGVLVFCVGVGKNVQKQLETIANPPQDHYVFITDRYEDLHRLLDRLLDRLLERLCISLEKPQKVLTKRYTDTFWLVDNSLPPEQFSQLKSNLSEILTRNEVGRSSNRLGLAQFGQDVQVEFLLNTYESKGQILEAVANFKLQPQPKQQRNLSRALEHATTRFFRAEAGGRALLGVRQDLFIVMENEQNSLSMLLYEVSPEYARILKALGVDITVMAKDAMFQCQSIPGLMGGIADNLLDFSPNGFRGLSDKMFSSGMKTVVEECEGAGVADVVFVLKGSEGTGEDNFPFVLTFLSLIINSLEISQAKVRVGIVTSGSWPPVEAHLNTFTGKAELLHFIGLLPPCEGGAKIGAALNLTREMLFSEENGGRRNAHKVAVVIADSKSLDSVREAASFLRRDGATIYAVGVKDADPTELEEMASHPPSRHVFPRANFSSLWAETRSLLKGLCNGIAEKQRTAGGSSNDVERACAETRGPEIFFLLDVSGRISLLDLRDMQNFVISFLRFLRIGPDHFRMGVFTYSHSTSLHSGLMDDADQIKEAVLALRREGGAAYVGKALSFLNEGMGETAQRQVPRYLVVISGGGATDDFKGPAEALRRKDITLFAIGAKKSNETQLTEISGDSRRTFYVNHFDALKSISDGVLAEICAPEACKAYPTDVFFLMSSSAALSKREFEKMKDLLKSVISMFTIGPNAVHVGVMQVGANHSLQFGLNKYFSREEVLRAVDRMSPVKDGYRIGRSLSEVSKYFKVGGGGRPGLKQSLVVVTDLQSTDEVRGPAEALRNKDVEIFAVGVLEASKKQLLEISNSSDKVFQVEDLDQLPAVGRPLALKLCGQDCEKKDLVFLLDHSTSISTDNHNMVINFTADLVSSLTIGENFLQVGLAQFSDALHHEFYLSEYSSKAEMVRHILSSKHVGGTTYLGKALRSVEDYFLPSRGARRGTSKTLVMITDGNSLDDVEDAAEGLRNMGIEILAVGVGDVYDLQLLRIVGNPKNLFSIWNFNFLAKNKKKVVDAICRKLSSQPKGCSIDVFIGFDVSRSGEALKTFLPGLEEIVRHISTVEDLCCSAAVHTNIFFFEEDADGFLRYNASFEEDSLREVLNKKWSQPTYFNSTLLNFFKKNFREKSVADIKVLLIFSDGLDDDMMKLEQASELLQKSGVSVLLTVALAGADPAQLQMVEFGRGFEYGIPLSIGQPSIGGSILQQISGAAHRLCCGVMCKCWGPAGDRGPSGIPGMKGSSGWRGRPGFPGEEGISGERGPPGQSGSPGPQGCPGSRGQKGSQGLTGSRGEAGQDGLDGVHGEQGDPGHDGFTGEPGHPGSPGAPGINGECGIEGQRGLRGDLGDAGAHSATRGPKGEPGPPGVPGESGADGGPGPMGSPGSRGPDGRKGPRGELGSPGGGGAPGRAGVRGTAGPQGPTGGGGDRGPRGVSGFPGTQGRPGPAGEPGQAGWRGLNGQKGHQGEPGLKGAAGPQGHRGAPGQDGGAGFGAVGPAGAKGHPGFPGHPGLQGEGGFKGTKGNPGPAGGPGGGGRSGGPGEAGASGDPGNPGHRGPKGPPGAPARTKCELTAFIRENCVCSRGESGSPVLPTELVFALDLSSDVSSSSFELQRSALLYLLEGVTLAQSSCPTGARVSVMGFHERSMRLIRFHEHSNHQTLTAALKDIPWTPSPFQRYLGAAMRFVGQSVFKHVRAGLHMRKVAIFFSSGETKDIQEVVTAVMEYRALNIVPVVVSLTKDPRIARAMEADDTGNSIFTVLEKQQDLAAGLRKVRNCAINFDPCRPSEDCSFIQDPPPPQQVGVDLGVVVDGSSEVQPDEFTSLQQLLVLLLDQLAVSPRAKGAGNLARVAVVQHGGAQDPTLEFGLQTFQDRDLMKRHLLQNMRQQDGPSLLGQTLEYTLRKVMLRYLLKEGRTSRNKALLILLATRTASEDQSALKTITNVAHCSRMPVFVLTVGRRYNQTQVEELASSPVQQHLIHLDRLGAEERGYAQRFFRVFLSTLSKGLNSYHPPLSGPMCRMVKEMETLILHDMYCEGREPADFCWLLI